MRKFPNSRCVLSNFATILLYASTVALAQETPKSPIPIWNGEGRVPQGPADQKVFLTPDEHSVIILWPNQDGTITRRQFDLHNTIYPELRVQMERSSDGYRYRYELENGKESKDSLTSFLVVVYPDPQMQASSALWKGGPSLPTVKERVCIPGAPPGRLVDWEFCLNERPMQPGANTNFTLITEARPGFTSASTEHFPHLDLTDEWPEDILDQLVVLEPKWIQYHFFTLGPRYGPDDPAGGIASDYLVGIQELIRIHRFEKDSPFVKEAIADLDAIASGSSAHFTITQKPASELEAEILSALELSLHIAYSAPK
jgi:hypothetical protein